MEAASHAVRRFRIKHIGHLSATGVNLKRRGHSAYDQCPYCGLPEDNLHLHQCQAVEPTNIIKQHLCRLRLHLKSLANPVLEYAFSGYFILLFS